MNPAKAITEFRMGVQRSSGLPPLAAFATWLLDGDRRYFVAWLWSTCEMKIFAQEVERRLQ